ncbi:MAG: hypothetical protein LQ342_007004 [Letrouitia transgressa]|nr:MAG: hypothetical protein LQ342_007004 [Letrouitia transgressa]
MPTEFFNRVAQAAGCPSGQKDVFNCPVQQDTSVLQKANFDITETARYRMWTFVPETDYKIFTQRPSQQLRPGKRLNGRRLMTSLQSTANEGPLLTLRDIATDKDFANYIHTLLPLLDEGLRKRVLQVYAPLSPQEFTAPFSTTGTSPPTALEVSDFAVGPQQRAFNLNWKITFGCLAYWLADAFSSSSRKSWKYEYSIPPASHAADFFGNGWLVDPTQIIPADFAQRFRKAWGNFIIHNDPDWQAWDSSAPKMQNLNVTGGFSVRKFTIAGLMAAQSYGDVRTDIRLVDAYTWEGNRGKRCNFWRRNADGIPA